MSIKKVRETNSQQFIDDLKKVSEAMVISHKSNAYLTVKKSQLLKEAQNEKIYYRLTREIYSVGRLVMVVL